MTNRKIFIDPWQRLTMYKDLVHDLTTWKWQPDVLATIARVPEEMQKCRLGWALGFEFVDIGDAARHGVGYLAFVSGKTKPSEELTQAILDLIALRAGAAP